MKKGLGLLVVVVCSVLFANITFAKDGYTIVPMPDTIVQKTPVDAAIYNNTAEFFTPYIINEMNKTQFMNVPTVSQVRDKIQADYWLAKATTKAMDDFRRFYKLDFTFAKKIAALYDTNLVLFLTSTTDSNNYILRRTWWDFFNVPGASVVDPAYKINIYAVLIDTDKDMIVWNKSYQKTISVVENRIIANGYAPQTEQLQKIKDYSVYLAPRVARSIQDTLLTAPQKAVESNMIHTDYGSIDNVFTKKYRGLRQEVVDATVIPAAKTREGYGIAKEKYNEVKEIVEEKWENRDKSKTNILPIMFFKKNTSKQDVSEPKSIPFIGKFFKPKQNPVPEKVEVVVPLEVEQKVVSPTTVEDVTVEIVEPKIDKTTVVKESEKSLPVVNVEAKPVKVQKLKIDAETLDGVEEVKKQPVSLSKPKEVEKSIKEVEEIKLVQPTPPVPEKSITIPSDIDESSQNILNKAFKKHPSVVFEEQPVDSVIYTHPTNYRSNDFLPTKPRLREINIDDTYNAF